MILFESRSKSFGVMLVALVLSVFFLSLSADARLPVRGPTDWPSDVYKNGGKAPDAKGQRMFRSPAEAVNALIGAMSAYDEQKVTDILGSEGKKFVFAGNSAAEDRAACDRYVKAYHEKNRIMKVSRSEAVLKIGKDERSFPVPMEKVRGYWRFAGHSIIER